MGKNYDWEALMKEVKKLRVYSSLFVWVTGLIAGLIITIIDDCNFTTFIITVGVSVVFGIVFYIFIGKDISRIINDSMKK